MPKIKIIKSISLILGIGIIFCFYLMFVRAFEKKIMPETGFRQEKKVINLAENAEIKNFYVAKNKIYILLQSPCRDTISVIDETGKTEIMTINVTKGECNE